MRYIYIMLLLLLAGMLPAIMIDFVPLPGYTTETNARLSLEVTQGGENVTLVEVWYRAQGMQDYLSIRMDRDIAESYIYTASLPVFNGQTYEYYFRFTLADGSVETYPVIEPETHPFLLSPESKSGTLSNGFVLLTDDESVLAKQGYLLGVSWYAMAEELDVTSIHVYVNGRDVTHKAHISQNVLLYKDSDPKPGVMKAYVTATTVSGKQVYSPEFVTVVKPGGNITTLPLNLRGSVNAGTNVYSTKRKDSTPSFGSDRDDGWLEMELYGEHKKLQLNAYTYLSTLEDEDLQPADRFRMGILLPFWETYIGDYSPNISSLTMNNRNLRGIYSYLHSRYIGLAVAHGQMVRAQKGELFSTTTADTLYTPGVFKQEALAVRLEGGNQYGLKIGVNTTRNRDIISSLDARYVLRDTTQIAYPKDNLVVSVDASFTVPGQNVTVGLEGAGSLYNNNTLKGALSQQELEDYLGDNVPVNPQDFQDLFIINTNMQPLPLSIENFDVKPYTAWQAYFRSMWFNNLINATYSEVGMSYHALSTNYLQNDAARLSITDQYNFRQYLFLSGGYNLIKDNLARTKLDNNLYQNYFAQLMLRLPRLPYLTLSYGNNQGENARNKRIVDDSTAIYRHYDRKSNLMGAGLGYNFTMIPYAPTTVDLGWRTNTEKQSTFSPSGASQVDFDNETENITLSFTSKWDMMPLLTRISFADNMQEYKRANDKNNNLNLLLRGEYRLWNDRINPWAEYRTTMLRGDQNKQNYTYFNLGVDARPWEQSSISTSFGIRNYNNKDIANYGYSTYYWRLVLSQRF